MKRLILMRHAKSSWDHPGMDDFDRPLNARGQRDAPEAGRRLRDFLQDTSLAILSSTALRAKTTAQAVRQELDFFGGDIEWDPDLYLCGAESWLSRIHDRNPVEDTLLTIGHNPGVTQLANRLSLAGIDNIPTAGIAAIEFDCEDWCGIAWGKGTLTWFDYPKLHGG